MKNRTRFDVAERDGTGARAADVREETGQPDLPERPYGAFRVSSPGISDAAHLLAEKLGGHHYQW